MSSFKNIIARRRPSIQIEPDDGASDQSVPEDADRPEPTRQGSGEQRPSRLVAPPPPAPGIPRWDLKPPPRTMGEELLSKPTHAPASETSKGDAASPPERRKIWDLDAESVPAKSTDKQGSSLHAPDAVPPVTLQEGATPDRGGSLPADPEPAPVLRGRVKTRLLGFHADEAIADPFSTDRVASASQSVKYPVGWVVVVDGPGAGNSFSLASGLSTIGRGADQTISIDFGDDCISRDTHASIAYDDEENKILIGHGGKANLVRLNGKPLVAVTEMHSGDQFRIGKTTLRFVALCGDGFRWPETSDNV